MFQPPDPAALDAVNEVTIEDLPRFAPVRYERDQPAVDDVEATTADALSAVDGLSDLDPGARVAITAGSRGIHDMPEVLRTAVDELGSMDLDPFVIPSMGSHGGATAEGQVETLASLGITEESMGCEIVASMDVERVGSDSDGRPIYASRDALEADAVLLVGFFVVFLAAFGLLIVLIALGALLYAGCDSGGDDGGDSDSSSSMNSLEVQHAWGGGDGKAAFSALIEGFREEYPDVTFDVQPVSGGANKNLNSVIKKRARNQNLPGTWQDWPGGSTRRGGTSVVPARPPGRLRASFGRPSAA